MSIADSLNPSVKQEFIPFGEINETHMLDETPGQQRKQGEKTQSMNHSKENELLNSDLSISNVFQFFGSFLPSAATIGGLIFALFMLSRLGYFLKQCWQAISSTD